MHYGGMLIAFGAVLGLAVSIYNFFSPVEFLAPDSSIAGTAGAGLVIFSTAVLAVFGLILARGVSSTALVWFLLVSSLLAILGTGFAAYLLNSMVLLVLMPLCFLGWLMRLAMRRAVPA